MICPSVLRFYVEQRRNEFLGASNMCFELIVKTPKGNQKLSLNFLGEQNVFPVPLVVFKLKELANFLEEMVMYG